MEGIEAGKIARRDVRPSREVFFISVDCQVETGA